MHSVSICEQYRNLAKQIHVAAWDKVDVGSFYGAPDCDALLVTDNIYRKKYICVSLFSFTNLDRLTCLYLNMQAHHPLYQISHAAVS